VAVVAVASRSGKRAEELAARLHVPLAGDDWKSLAARTQPHACVVAVSHAVNEEITRAALASDLHVLAEKPVAFSSAAVRELAELARRRGLITMAAVNRRYYDNVLAALDEVRYCGRLLAVTAFAPDPVRARRAAGPHAAMVYDHWTLAQTLHLIDLLRLAGGELEQVLKAERIPAPDSEGNLLALLRFSSGTLVTYVAMSSSGGDWELRLHGESVEARLAPLEQGSIRVGSGPPRPLPDPAADRRLKAGVLGQARAFAEAVRWGTAPGYPASDFADHARSVALAERLQQLASPPAG
jgi:predicted dehydrogenase